jgi:hypothetical protein
MKFKNPKIEKLYEHLSQITSEAYKDEFLISNIAFSKQESNDRILEIYLTGESPPNISLFYKLKKLLLYLAKNFIGWTFLVIAAIFHKISKQNFSIKNENELILVDTYFVITQIFERGEFEDIFFPGLSEYLTKRKKNYAYIPRWFGSKQPFGLFRVFKIIKEKKIPVLTQYQVLSFPDYVKALRFLILYPFSLFRFMKKLGSSYEDNLIRYALWEVFDGGVIEHYVRFLFGRRLSSIIPVHIKCLSWYESLAADKSFYLGLRTIPDKTKIIGAQLFVRPSTLMNIVTDEQEILFKVIPDKILVNGSGYNFNSDKVKVATGPALRYKHLFTSNPHKSSKEIILVILPYFDHATKNTLELVNKVEWPVPVEIKFHSTMDWKNYEAMIPENFSVTNEPISQLLKKTLIAVGQSTGGLMEAGALGIPAIDIQYPEKFSHFYMPETGKGILWDQAKNATEIELLLKQFQKTLKENPEKLKEEGEKMKSFCFSDPTEEAINQAFELD